MRRQVRRNFDGVNDHFSIIQCLIRIADSRKLLDLAGTHRLLFGLPNVDYRGARSYTNAIKQSRPAGGRNASICPYSADRRATL